MSWPAVAAAGAAEPDWDPRVGAQAVSHADGHGDQTSCGATRAEVGGRSRVIHAFFVGL
jgi:hypothetical protein